MKHEVYSSFAPNNPGCFKYRLDNCCSDAILWEMIDGKMEPK